MSYSHEYYLKNREKYLEATRKYIAKKRVENDEKWLEKQNKYMKKYYLKNPDKRNAKREYDKEWRKNHPDYYQNHRRKEIDQNETQ